ncbi:MAG: hypothetical protein HY702_07475 [Gemmatimonadetes bacterium]|nr:hypothetical protein [Gemmatimonadota bacterium]
MLFIVGLPIVLATAFVQEGGPPLGRRYDATLLPGVETEVRARAGRPTARRVHRLLTWRNAFMGGVFTFALWGVIAAGWLLLKGTESRGPDRDESLGGATPVENAVAVLPFRTVGSGLELWGEGLVDLLSIQLDGAGGLRAVAPGLVLSRLKRQRPVSEALEPAVATRLARELGAGTYVTGSVVETGPGRVRLLVEAFDAIQGRKRPEASFALDGAESNLASLADSAGLALLSNLSRIPLPEAPIGRRPTQSVAALRAFLTGEQAFREGHWAEADARYAEALQLDPIFALPLYRRFQLRYRGQVTTPPSEAELIAEALSVADRLPERERRLLHAIRRSAEYLDTTDLAERLDFTRRYPEDPEGWVWVAEWYYHAGAVYGEPWSRVLEYGKRALALDSTLWTAYHHPIEVAARMGDSATARALLARYLQLVEPGDRVARAQELAFQLRFSHPDSARRMVSSFTGESERVLARLVGEILRFDPSPNALALAEDVARLEVRLARSAESVNAARARLAELQAARGRLTDARATLEELLRDDPRSLQGAIAGALPVLAGFAAPTGGFARAPAALRTFAERVQATGPSTALETAALTLVSRLDLKFGDATPAVARSRALRSFKLQSEVVRGYIDLDSAAVFARVALMRGDTGTAIGLLTTLTNVSFEPREIPTGFGAAAPADEYLLASLYVARGERDRARTLLALPERFPKLGGGILGLKLLLLAELAEQAGETAEARARYGDVLALWRDGDPVVQPHVERARTGLARVERR